MPDYLIGYTYEGGAYHRDCFPARLDPQAEDVGAVFSYQEEACEFTCDVCLEPRLACECTQDAEDE